MFKSFKKWLFSWFLNDKTFESKDFFIESSRDPRWITFRNKVIANKKCVICGSLENLELHHKKPFHEFPELELDEKNVVALCNDKAHNCHFIFGHLMDWRAYNHDLDNTIAYFQMIMKKAKMRAARERAKAQE